jgi:pyruvate, water dikinase
MEKTGPGKNPLSWMRSLFFANRRAAKAAKEKQLYPQHIKLMYENFREILALNDSTLQLISDVEDRLLGRVAFSYNLIVGRIRRAVMDVFMMVKSLDQLAGGKYSDLFDSLRNVKRGIEAGIPDQKESLAGPLVMGLQDIKAGDAPLVGTKMANLGEVRNNLGMAVPDGFAVTTVAFNRFLNHHNIRDKAERLEELLETTGARVAGEACRELQQMIISASMPVEIEKAIERSFADLCGSEDCLVAVRSSGVAEDQVASHAGLFYTELNVGKGWLFETYRWVLASTYGVGPVQYRLKYGLTSEDSQMAVGILKMVEPQCSGVMFSRGFENRKDDRVVISVVAGLTDPGQTAEMKTEELIYAPGQEDAIVSSILNADQINLLYRAARRIEEHFGSAQDIEYVFDSAGQLFIMQCRPMGGSQPEIIPRPQQVETTIEPILSGGFTACSGVGAGTVCQIQNDGDLDRFPDGGILVAKHSSPKYVQTMNRCAAIVTDEGSPMGHMGILAREFGIPTIVGLHGASDGLFNSRVITVDATSRKVYEGIIIDLNNQPPKPSVFHTSPAARKLREIAKLVAPLHLIDTSSTDFTPSHCQSLHDITRYVHEKLFEEMFYLGSKASLSQPSAIKLKGNLPYEVLVLDVGGGIGDGANLVEGLDIKDIISSPMKMFLEGLLDRRIVWDKPRALSARGFASILGEGIAGLPAEAKGIGRLSFAIMSDKYMNFSTKAGYHFNTVDTYCGRSINKNYIHFRFEGGAANETRRQRRCQFLSLVLEALGFKVQVRGDAVVGRLEKYEQEFIATRLTELGRLTLCARQMDMLMDSDGSPDFFSKSFLEGKMENF